MNSATGAILLRQPDTDPGFLCEAIPVFTRGSGNTTPTPVVGWRCNGMTRTTAYISEIGNDVTPSSTNVWAGKINLRPALSRRGGVYELLFPHMGRGGSYSEFQDCRCEEIIPAELIVDGAIQSKMPSPRIR